MDDRLEKALDFSNLMITLNNQRNLIHEKFLENCVHYVNGGKFNVNRDIINFCHTLIQNGQKSAILLDDNNTPIEVKELEDFLDEILSIYSKNMNEYLQKFNEIKKNRSVEGILNI
tara:strand:+ start:511 stop:858 length:348 start_codon:yes stop_codon:yes gene_type:complete